MGLEMTVGMVFTEGGGVDAMAVIAAGSGGGLDSPVLSPVGRFVLCV
jgi:hypothetical protein